MKTSAWSALLLVGMSACSFSESGKNRVTVTIDEGARALSDLMPFLTGPAQPPSLVSGFDCLAVNVMGPGIQLGYHHDQSNVIAYQNMTPFYEGTTFCSYPGIMSSPILNDVGTKKVTLSIPSGPSRIVQMLGIVDPVGSVCGFQGPVNDAQYQGEYFDIGHIVTPIFTNLSVAIPNQYDALTGTPSSQLARAAGCGGHSDSYGGTVMSTPGLVAYWGLVDPVGSAAAANYQSGSALPPLAQSNATFGQSGPLTGSVNANSNSSVSMGTTALLSAATTSLFTFTGYSSIELWFKIPSGADCGAASALLEFKSNSGTAGTWIRCAAANGQLTFAYDNGSISNFVSIIGLNDGAWHQAVGTFDGSVSTIYIDTLPTLSSPSALGTITLPVGSTLKIGTSTSSLPSTTLVSHVSLYNTALTQAQVSLHYQRAQQ